MTQIATVEEILSGGYALISVPRKSACGHDCEDKLLILFLQLLQLL